MTVYSLLLLLPLQGITQTKHTNQLWLGYYNTLNISHRWGVNTDIQIRTTDWTKEWATRLIRTGLYYKMNEAITITAGLAFFQQAQYTANELLFKNEWRPWQELSVVQKWKKTNCTQRIRTEQRMLQQVKNDRLVSDYIFVFRLRYRFDLQYPIEEGRFTFSVGNELMINPAYVAKNNFFDQNRTSAGINWRLTEAFSVQAQYIAIYQKKFDDATLQKIQVIRFNLLHTLFIKTKNDDKGNK